VRLVGYLKRNPPVSSDFTDPSISLASEMRNSEFLLMHNIISPLKLPD